MLITCGGNILIRDIDAAMVLFGQHGASGRLFRVVYEVSSAWFGIASSRVWGVFKAKYLLLASYVTSSLGVEL